MQTNIVFTISVQQRILKKIMVSMKILSCTNVLNIDNISWNISWASNQHIKMISEGSCDTEDWSNDAETSDPKLLNGGVDSNYYFSYK